MPRKSFDPITHPNISIIRSYVPYVRITDTHVSYLLMTYQSYVRSHSHFLHLVYHPRVNYHLNIPETNNTEIRKRITQNAVQYPSKPPNRALLSLTKCQKCKNENYSGSHCSRATVRDFYEGENGTKTT